MGVVIFEKERLVGAFIDVGNRGQVVIDLHEFSRPSEFSTKRSEISSKRLVAGSDAISHRGYRVTTFVPLACAVKHSISLSHPNIWTQLI